MQVIKRQGGSLSSEMSKHYSKLATDCTGARITSNNPEVASRLTTSVLDLGAGVIRCVNAAASCHVADVISLRGLSDSGRDVAEKVKTY